MGAATSQEDASTALFNADGERFAISSVRVYNAASVCVLAATVDGGAVAVTTGDAGGLVEFVQDYDAQGLSPMLVKVAGDAKLRLVFRLVVKHRPNLDPNALPDVITGLTFLNSPSRRALDTLLTKQLQSNPNIQNNDNVCFIGDAVADGLGDLELEWAWDWTPPSDVVEPYSGWRNTCCFAEYDKRDHKLNVLSRFSFWVADCSRAAWMLSPAKPSPVEREPEPRRKASGAEDPPAPARGRPADDQSQPEDGPLFRATVAALEKKTAGMKAVIKKLLKRSSEAYAAKLENYEAGAHLLETLREAKHRDLVSIQPAVDDYFDVVGREILRFERQSFQHLHHYFIEPLRRLYDLDIKVADAKKREFDEESREYYAWLSRYLSTKQEAKGKKKTEIDSKYQDKRKNFELKRFDYYTFIRDLHGGRKEQEIAYQLSLYAEAQMRQFLAASRAIGTVKAKVDGMIAAAKENKDEWGIWRTEREEKRRALEISAMPEPPAGPAPAPPAPAPLPDTLSPTVSNSSASGLTAAALSRHLSPDTITPAPTPPALSASAPAPSKFKGIRDLDEAGAGDDDARRKEGLLWALSKPGGHGDPLNLNKAAWHKFWVVLAGGRLCEYSNWKQSLDLHNEPINLKMASVREARNSERRFCFEVITPHYKRVYQATSEEDMHSWINVVSNAITSTLEGTGSVKSFPTSESEGLSPERSTIGQVFSKTTNLTALHRRVTVNGSRSTSQSMRSSASVDAGTPPRPADDSAPPAAPAGPPAEDPQWLLQRLRDADPANNECADCGGTAKVEWVSINLLVILCIECGGLHRSLGTHITKVRSLKLDTVSFTPDLVDALVAVGNTRANAVWEETLDPAAGVKPAGASARTAKLEYITAKYVDREFMKLLPQPNSSLRAAVKRQDMVTALRALASQANPNAAAAPGRAQTYALVLTALIYADRESRTFPMAELLLQYGAKLPREVPPEIRLTAEAHDYLAQKLGKRNRTLATPEPPTAPSMATASLSAATHV
ncbi:uncharacterized protein V1510DRAFT_446660 [Dipodascopsis tothii]|uniref:uncharacterized protein n=1 Tax=Dipodascopsis tothii TaxID=44089 RepID=UPI0034CDF2CA